MERAGFVQLRAFRVSDRPERDVLRLPGHRRFSEVKVCVERRAVRFLNFDVIFKAIADLGWPTPLGAEYKPVGETASSLGWLRALLA